MDQQAADTWHWQEPGTTWKGCGIYHITLTQTDRSRPLLGHLTDSSTAEEATVVRTELGNTIVEQFLAIPTHRPEVKPLSFCLMPDHFHGVLYVQAEMQSGIKSLVRGFWQGCKKVGRAYTIADKESLLLPSIESMDKEGRIQSVRKNEEMADWTEDPIFCEMPFIVPLAGNGQLDSMIRYVHDNPRRAWLKRRHPELFRIRREIAVSLHDIRMTFSGMGNMFLLDWPLKQQVECSRTISVNAFNKQKAEVMNNAEQGFVTITAAINEWEKDIAKAVREAGYPLIVLLKDGFPADGDRNERFFKPHGIYFDACAAGKLLLLEPTEATFADPTIAQLTQANLREKAARKHQEYTPLPTDSQRYHYVALNNIGRLLIEGQ